MKNNTMMLALTKVGILPSKTLQTKLEKEHQAQADYKAKKKLALEMVLAEEEAYREKRDKEFRIGLQSMKQRK